MGTAREPEPVKLIASLFSADLALLEEAKATLSRNCGQLDFESDLLPFDHTDYYRAEFGSGLQRRIVAFEPLVPMDALPAIKHRTNSIESAMARGDQRLVNIDPGYVSLGKMVLASTKDHAHRLYLDQGIYGEITLTYQRGRFRPWPWTYPDYASDGYCAMFDGIRARYKSQLRGGGRYRAAEGPLHSAIS
jgi:hypothetical protein